MGMRIASEWNRPVSLVRPRAAANDPKPSTVLKPPNTMAAVHALCNKIKSRLVKLTAHIRGVAAVGDAEVDSDGIGFMEIAISLVLRFQLNQKACCHTLESKIHNLVTTVRIAFSIACM